MVRSIRRSPRGTSALRLATRTGELALAAPIVVAARTAGILAAGATPDAAQRAEMLRMTSEKVAAFNEAWFAMAARWHRVQVEWGLAALRAMLDTWRFPSSATNPYAIAQTLASAAGQRWLRGWHDIANAGLVPVHRTATRNARRLSRRRR